MQNLQRIVEQLQKYRDRLADFSRRNKELYYRLGKATSLNLGKNPFRKTSENEVEKNLAEAFRPLSVSDGSFAKLVESGQFDLTSHFAIDKLPNLDLIKRLDKIRLADQRFQREYGISGAWLLGPFICWRAGNEYDSRDLLVSPIFKLPIDLEVQKKSLWSMKIEDANLSLNNSLLLAIKRLWDIEIDFPEDATVEQVISGICAKLKTANIQCDLQANRDSLPHILPKRIIKKDPETGEIIEERPTSIETDLTQQDAELYKSVTNRNFIILDVFFVDHLNASRMALYNDYDRLIEGDMDHGPLAELLLGLASKEKKNLPNTTPRELDGYRENQNLFSVDIDSSQHRALISSKALSTFVIQGPPGTGKSQTITNLIAEQLKNGKRVLFVSEKRPALDVVFNRLTKCNLGENAVVIHGSELDKKALYQSFADSFHSKIPTRAKQKAWEETCAELDTVKSYLGDYRRLLEVIDSQSELSIADIFSLYPQFETVEPISELGEFVARFPFGSVQKMGETLNLIRDLIGKIPKYQTHIWLYRKESVILLESLRQKYIRIASEVEACSERKRKIESLAQTYKLSNSDLKFDLESANRELASIQLLKNIFPLLRTGEALKNDIESLCKSTIRSKVDLSKLKDLITKRPISLSAAEKYSSVWRKVVGGDFKFHQFKNSIVEFISEVEANLSGYKKIDPQAELDLLKEVYNYFKIPRGFLSRFTAQFWKIRSLAKSLMIDPNLKVEVKAFRSAIQIRESLSKIQTFFSQYPEIQPVAQVDSLGKEMKDISDQVEKIVSQNDLALSIGLNCSSFADIGYVSTFSKLTEKVAELQTILDRLASVSGEPLDVGAKNDITSIVGLNLDLMELCRNYSFVNDLAEETRKIDSRIDHFYHLIEYIQLYDQLVSDIQRQIDLAIVDLTISPFSDEDTVEYKLETLKRMCGELEDLPILVNIDETIQSLHGLGFVDAKLKILKYFASRPELSWSDFLKGQAVKHWYDRILANNRSLLKFSREWFEKQSLRFNELESAHRELSQQMVNLTTGKNRLDLADSPGHKLISKQSQNSKRHMSPRQLMEKGALEAMLGSKPCWLMNPLTISQILPFDKNLFDVVIFDEASQVRVEDAIPSIYRGSQLIVVGDNRQMPPTNFFSGTIDDEEDDEPMPESLLDLAINVAPSEMLLWHYRSHSESLISFSNRAFYGGRLIAAPNPKSLADGAAISLKILPEGTFTQKTGNMTEARALIAELATYLKGGGTHSVGVIAMGTSQVVALEAALEEACSADPEFRDLIERASNYKENGVLTGLFIKNLENVQGDERDVIFVSVGYAPAATGKKLHMRFGPLSSQGGERRLNVAITRARKQMKVFMSFEPDEIGAEAEDFSRNPATTVFGKWLKYVKAISKGSEESARAILNSFGVYGQASQREPTRFNLAVKKKLEERGFKVSTEIGTCGFYVDLGIHHPVLQNNFILGVECDGATFHSSDYSRERDKLRQKLLEDRGWKIARIWSQDWSNNWRAEIDRIVSILEAELRRSA